MENSYGLIQLFQDGGFMMYFLLLCLAARARRHHRQVYVLWVAHRDTRGSSRRSRSWRGSASWTRRWRSAERTPGPVAAILLSGLNRIRDQRPGNDVEQAMSSTGKIELGFLERGLVVLATVATVAPLLGFLGHRVGDDRGVRRHRGGRAGGGHAGGLRHQDRADHHRRRAGDRHPDQHRLQLLRDPDRQPDPGHGGGDERGDGAALGRVRRAPGRREQWAPSRTGRT